MAGGWPSGKPAPPALEKARHAACIAVQQAVTRCLSESPAKRFSRFFTSVHARQQPGHTFRFDYVPSCRPVLDWLAARPPGVHHALQAVTSMRHTREILEGTLLTVAPPTANSTCVRLCCAARYSSHTALHGHQQQCTPYCPCATQVQQAMQSWQPQVHMSYVTYARPPILRRTWAVAEAACGSEGAGMGHEQLAHSGSLQYCCAAK